MPELRVTAPHSLLYAQKSYWVEIIFFVIFLI